MWQTRLVVQIKHQQKGVWVLRILIINPNSDLETNRILKTKADAFLKDNCQVDCVNVTNAPKLVSAYEDYCRSTPEMIAMVREGQTKYDAFIVACHSDPNLDVLREISTKPVVGIAESSMKFASMLGNGFAVISPSPKSISKKYALARKYHCDHLLKTIQVSASDDEQDLLVAAQKATQVAAPVDVIVLGCANYANADKYLEKELGIPVIDGLACALILASGLAAYQQYHNK
jgi:Hydantoin racemase